MEKRGRRTGGLKAVLPGRWPKLTFRGFSQKHPKLTVVAEAVEEVGIPPLLRDFQVQGESPALGLFLGAASSTALLTHKYCYRALVRLCVSTLGIAGISCLLAGCGTGVSTPGAPGSFNTGFSQAASTQQWIVKFGAGAIDLVTGVAVGPHGNLAVGGITLGAFPGYTNPNQVSEDFVAKFAPTGKQLWLKQFGTGAPKGDFLTSIATDAQGDILVGGGTTGAFPGYSNPRGTLEAVVAKLDSQGNQIWLQQFSVSQGIEVNCIASAPDGSIMVAGDLNQNLQQVGVPGGGTETDVTAEEEFIAKLDGSSGTVIWQRNLQQYAIAAFESLTVDAQGNSYVSGTTQASYSLSPSPLLLKYSATGAEGWVQQLQGTSYASGIFLTGVTVARTGDPVVVGCPIENSVAPVPGCLLAEYDNATGNQVWLTPFGRPSTNSSGGIGTDPSGNILIAGYTQLQFLPAFNVKDDVYVAKFNGSGQNIWLQQFNDTDYLVPPYGRPSLAVDGQGNTYLGDTTSRQGTSTGATTYFSEPLLAKFGP